MNILGKMIYWPRLHIWTLDDTHFAPGGPKGSTLPLSMWAKLTPELKELLT